MNKRTLPNSLLFLYGIGVSYAILDQIFVQWVLYYYLPPAHSGLQPLIAPISITIALVISRVIDVVFDPLVGFMSDNFKSKLGRRIPFILLGGLPLALCTIGFFYPPSFMRIEFYLPIIGSLFFIFYSIVGAPYNSLIPEISKSQADRVNLSTAQSVFRLLYTAAAMILPGYMIVKFGGGDTEKGLKLMVITLSVFSLVGMYTTGFFVKERKYSNYDKEDKHHHGFKESLKIVFNNRQFKYYLLGLLFFFVGFNTLRTCINYYVEDIMGYGKAYITIASALLFGVSALCFYPVNRISKKYGYRKPMLVFLLMLFVLSMMLFSLGKFINPKYGVVLFGLIGVPTAGCAFIFPPAMLSEIAAKSTRDTNINLEGMHFGIQGFFLKLAFLVSVGFVPLLLVSNGFGGVLDSIINSSNTVEVSGIYTTTLFAAISFVLSFIFYYRYEEVMPEPDQLEKPQSIEKLIKEAK